MPRAEVGSTKHIANQMKAKGLQRLRWYCQACQRQMRDENGFKCHVASESHVRNMMVIGEDPRKAINEFSTQFQRDFIQLLRIAHGEKKVNVNHFYQEYISNKEHIHMNSTKWASLTEFAKHLGREGICRVEEDEKNNERGGASALTISWIDNSPEKLRRQEAIKKRDRQDRGDEEREQRMIAQQIKRARKDGMAENEPEDDNADLEDSKPSSEGINRNGEEKIRLNFGIKKTVDAEKPPSPPLTEESASPKHNDTAVGASADAETTGMKSATLLDSVDDAKPKVSIKPVSFGTTKPKNVFSMAGKKNALSSGKKTGFVAQQKSMSEAERIMKEEMERKRIREQSGGNVFKKQRVT